MSPGNLSNIKKMPHSSLKPLAEVSEDVFKILVEHFKLLLAAQNGCDLCGVYHSLDKEISIEILEHIKQKEHKERLNVQFIKLRRINAWFGEQTKSWCHICNIDILPISELHYRKLSHVNALSTWWNAKVEHENFLKTLGESEKQKYLKLVTECRCYICSVDICGIKQAHVIQEKHKYYVNVFLNIHNSKQALSFKEKNAINTGNYQELENLLINKLRKLQQPRQCEVCLVAPPSEYHYLSKKHKGSVSLWYNTMVNKIKEDYQIENWEVNENPDLPNGPEKKIDPEIEKSIEQFLKSQITIDFCYVCFKKLRSFDVSKQHYASKDHEICVEKWYISERQEMMRQKKTDHKEMVATSSQSSACDIKKFNSKLKIVNSDLYREQKSEENFKSPISGTSIEALPSETATENVWNSLQLKKNDVETRQSTTANLETKLESLMDPTFCGICYEKFETPFHAELHYNSDRHVIFLNIWKDKETEKMVGPHRETNLEVTDENVETSNVDTQIKCVNTWKEAQTEKMDAGNRDKNIQDITDKNVESLNFDTVSNSSITEKNKPEAINILPELKKFVNQIYFNHEIPLEVALIFLRKFNRQLVELKGRR